MERLFILKTLIDSSTSIITVQIIFQELHFNLLILSIYFADVIKWNKNFDIIYKYLQIIRH